MLSQPGSILQSADKSANHAHDEHIHKLWTNQSVDWSMNEPYGFRYKDKQGHEKVSHGENVQAQRQ